MGGRTLDCSAEGITLPAEDGVPRPRVSIKFVSASSASSNCTKGFKKHGNGMFWLKTADHLSTYRDSGTPSLGPISDSLRSSNPTFGLSKQAQNHGSRHDHTQPKPSVNDSDLLKASRFSVFFYDI